MTDRMRKRKRERIIDEIISEGDKWRMEGGESRNLMEENQSQEITGKYRDEEK